MRLKESIEEYSDEFDKSKFLVEKSDQGFMTLYDYVGDESDVVLPEGIEAVNGIMWSNGYKIEKLTFPTTLKTLDEFRFDFLNFLECVVFQECQLTKIPDHLFSDSNIKKIVWFSNNLKEIGKLCFNNCKKLKEVFISNSVEKIGDSAFSGSGIEEIYLPENLKELGDGAFFRCHALSKVFFNNSLELEVISRQAFCETNLDNIILPKNLKQIGEGSFSSCDKLSSVNVPDSVEQIEKYAFGMCKNLKYIVVGNNCKYIDEAIFCSNYDVVLYYPDDFKYADRISPNINAMPISDPKSAKTNKDGCYVATCVYGSYDCPQVWTLRRFRDDTLRRSFLGNLFVKCYYGVSPTAVKLFGNYKWFHELFKSPLDKLVNKLNKKGVDNTPYYDR